MAAIISEKFRIFNATQFLESLSEGASQTDPDRTRMYFFVGRPQQWDAYVEIYNANSTAFVAGNEVYVGSNYGTATWKGTIRAVTENSLLVYGVGPSVTSTPSVGSTLKGYNGTADTGAEATSGVYRYSTENAPPVPLDNQTEKFDIYDDMIAAKRVTDQYARTVIRRYNWDTIANPIFDMWKPDYSATPGGGGQVGKQTATGASSIADAKFYIVNGNYQVFKCLYNGNGANVTYEPTTTPSAGQGTYANGLYKEPNNTYIWKYMYTMPTDDVLRFLSTDFMPIAAAGEATRTAVEAAAVAGAIDVVLVEDAGSGMPNGTFYAPIIGDGTGGVVEIVVSSGTVDTCEVVTAGSGYTYATVPVVTGTGSGATAYGLFSDQALTSSATNSGGVAALEVVIPPQGGHGSNFEQELNGKRVMLNIRLTFAEGSGDFPVDNDFRRIGLIKDPFNFGTTDFAVDDTRQCLYGVKLENATADYQVDEEITQTVTGGTAKGKVVSWTLDSGSTTSGVLKYLQSPALHTDNGVVRAFETGTANIIRGAQSTAEADVDNLENTNGLLGMNFSSGLANPELANNSGDLIYIENRRLITRAADQIEDIKLVIEF